MESLIESIPQFSVDLIRELRLNHPAPTADALRLPDEERHFLAGQQSIIEFLEARLEQQVDDVLTE